MHLKHLMKYIVDSEYRFYVNDTHGFYNTLSDEKYLKKRYRIKFGKSLNLVNPQTFNEKIQWLKLYDHNPNYPNMVDKIEAKKIVSDKIGCYYTIPTFGVWDNFEDIEFESLPNQFVLKCSHDSGGIIICRNKENFDLQKAKKIIKTSLSKNYYLRGREWPYKQIEPRILAEMYLQDNDTEELKDYKFMCFNGTVKCCFVCSERFSSNGLHVTFFDREWNRMPFTRHYPQSKMDIPKPKQLKEMISIAEELSCNIPFVRIDLYDVNDRIYFGEYTFFPGSGFEEFTPEKWDTIIGKWIDLPPHNV